MAQCSHSGYQTTSGSFLVELSMSRLTCFLVKGAAVFIAPFYCPWTGGYTDGERDAPGKGSLPLTPPKAAAAFICEESLNGIH